MASCVFRLPFAGDRTGYEFRKLSQPAHVVTHLGLAYDMTLSEAPELQEGEPLETAGKQADPLRSACPHLGLLEDPETRYAFPSRANACHFVTHPQEVEHYYQLSVCLTPHYGACSLLQQAAGPDSPARPGKLPAHIAWPDERSALRRRLLSWALTILALTVVLGVALLLSGLEPLRLAGLLPATGTDQPEEVRGDAGAAGASAVLNGAALPDRQPTATTTPRPSATPGPDAVEPAGSLGSDTPAPTPSVTPSPTPTATPTASAAPTAGPTRTPRPSPTATETLPQLSIAVRLLNVFAGPGPDYPVLAWAARDERFEIIGRNRNGSWFHICCLPDGRTGWVYFENVIILGDTSAVPDISGTPWP